MGNQPSKNIPTEYRVQSFQQRSIHETVKQTTPQRKWSLSQKTIDDMKQLMRSDTQWPQVVRHFFKTITSKHEYQRYLRAILEQILELSCGADTEKPQREALQQSQLKEQSMIGERQKLIKERKSPDQEFQNDDQPKQAKGNRISKGQLSELFSFYKTRLQQSYFIVTHQKGGIRQNMGEVPFESSLAQLDSGNSNQQSYHQSHFPQMIASLMASQLYQYPSITPSYMSELFMQLNLKAYQSLEEFTHLLVEEFLLVEDEFNLLKFVVEYDVMMKSLVYVETCAKMMGEKEREETFEKIRKLKQKPALFYIGMCNVFLKYRNVQAAQAIIGNMILKGYRLSEEHLVFYLCVELCSIFMYELNFSNEMFAEYRREKHGQKIVGKGSFVSFSDGFQALEIQDVLDMFLAVRSYNEIEQIRRCFVKVYSLYQPKRGEKLFLKYLKKYALGPKSHFIVAIEALKIHLSGLEEQVKEEIELEFLKKLSLEISMEIIEYERHVIEVMKMYHFSCDGYEFVKVIFKVSAILNKFQISLKVSELCQFLFHNRKLASFLKFKDQILCANCSHSFSSQQLQFQALIIMKKVITRYFTLSQSRQQVVFLIEDKFDSQCFQYSTKQIESLFIMTEYLHTNMLSAFIPLQQLHQLLFRQMLQFGKYEEVEKMMEEENLQRYFIQREVVKMLVLENVREMLVKNQKNVTVISQDVKKQLKIFENLIANSHQSVKPNKLLQFDPDQPEQQHPTKSLPQIDPSQSQQLESIHSLFRLMIKLDFYSISLSQQQKENISINLLYFLISHYEHQIEVFDYDELYRLILFVQGKHQEPLHDCTGKNENDSKFTGVLYTPAVPVTNEYLKFKIDLAQLAYEKGKIKFGQQVLKQVLQYEPPWISSEIIKIIQKSPHSAAINHSFLNIAFEYCVKGQDLVFLLQVWKQKMAEKHKKSNKKISSLFESTKKYIIVDDSYVKDEKQYRNLVAEMTFNDETLKSKDYEMFFSLLGAEPERAFYMIYGKDLDVVKIEIILKHGMKLGIFNCVNVTQIFFKLLYFMVSKSKAKSESNKSLHNRISFIKFKNATINEVMDKTQAQKLLDDKEKSKPYQKEIPFIFMKKMYKAVKSLLLLPVQFIQNYLENSSNFSQQNMGQYLQMFLYDQNHREKHLIALKDEPMGKNDINLYRKLCSINGINILDLMLFNLANQLNTGEIRSAERLLEDENLQNVLQKIVTWTENDVNLLREILGKLVAQIYSSQILYHILIFLREKQNPLMRQVITFEHMEIFQSLKQIQVNTELHGMVTQKFFMKPISYSPKQKLSEKHMKILKKQLKLRNVFLISKIMYFCYGMSSQVEKQVLKLFIKENENEHEKQIFEQLKAKLNESGN